MHATQFLVKHLRAHCQGTHRRRMDAVIAMVGSLLRGQILTVTGLGRSLQSGSAPKHQIKKADRLIGNTQLHCERRGFYQALARLTLGNMRRPVIIVDWSDVTEDQAFQKLRASVAVNGRALTLYEEVHGLSMSANGKVHTRFLQRLRQIVPARCHPIVVTDAGFKNPWFKAVASLGWDFVGRVGGHIMYRETDSKRDWTRVERLFDRATSKARYYGNVELARANPLSCYAYLFKRKPAGRIKKTRFGKKCAMRHSLKNAHRERTPWLLVTSLQGGRAITKDVIHIYQSRMQIEEAFRDLKNHRYGFSFRDSMTRTLYRLENLLLVAALASLAAWLVGKVAELTNLHRRYQANTIRNRNVLSTVNLGCQVLASPDIVMTGADFTRALQLLHEDRYAPGLAA